MPLIKQIAEDNEDSRGNAHLIYHHWPSVSDSLRCLVAGYDALLPPQYLQTEVPSVSHS